MNKRILIRVSCISILALIALAFAFGTERVSTQRQDFIDYALQFRGTPYVYGGRTPEEGFDCSGYVSYVTNYGLNIQLPRTAQAIYQKVDPVTVKEREPGDLVFFKNDMSSDKVTHVGIYLGVYHGNMTQYEGKRVFISAVSDGPETGVVIRAMDENFWKTHYFASGRILPSSKEAKAAEEASLGAEETFADDSSLEDIPLTPEK